MIADYRVPSNLTSLESTTDGKSVALGLVDGNLLILTIADTSKKKMIHYLRSLPSREGMKDAFSVKFKNRSVAVKNVKKVVANLGETAKENKAAQK